MTKFFVSGLVLALGVGLMACAAPAAEDTEEDGVSAEEALHTRVQAGTFRLYDQPHAQPNPGCDVHTSLVLEARTYGSYAKLAEAVGGFCEIYVAPNARTFRLRELPTSCGSKIYEGSRYSKDGARRVRITDHRTRTCRDLVPATIIVEETVPGFPGAITTTKYSADGAPAACAADADCGAGNVCMPGLCRMMCIPGVACCAPNKCAPKPAVITVDGTFVQTAGIGGENTGASILAADGLYELVLDDAERARFTDGAKAKVKGSLTYLSGVETTNRRAIDVSEMLTCPAPGTINCMPQIVIPGMPSGASRLCSETSWISANCPGVDFVY